MISHLSRRAFSRAIRTRNSKVSPQNDCRRCCLSTYYDSQSGLHLPVHNETEIKLILDVRNFEVPFLHQNVNKDRLEAEELQEKLEDLATKGIHGAILPAIKFPRDVRNLQTLSIVAPPGFAVLLDNNNSTSDTVDDGLLKAKELSENAMLSKVLNYQEGFGHVLQSSVDKALHTTLSVEVNDTDEPIALANAIASKIDAHGGCDYIWISSRHADTMTQVCEELVYLDLAGATVKSRLLVNAFDDDVIEDTMFAGVNKYVIEDEDQADRIQSVAQEQGKELLRT